MLLQRRKDTRLASIKDTKNFRKDKYNRRNILNKNIIDITY